MSSLAIVCSATADGARRAAVTMNWLGHNGYHHLVRRSCVVINHLVPVSPQIDVMGLGHQYERLVGQGRVVLLPWDTHVATGGEVRLDLVSRGYRREIVELAAAISADFASFDGPLDAGAAWHAAPNDQRPGFAGASPAPPHGGQGITNAHSIRSCFEDFDERTLRPDCSDCVGIRSASNDAARNPMGACVPVVTKTATMS